MAMTSISENMQLTANSDPVGVFVSPGPGGWGKGLYLTRDEQKTKVISLTGGGIHPVAKKIAELMNCEVVDAYEEKVDLEEMICAVIDCGGNARMGVYPMKRVPTINVKPLSPSGPMASFITEDIFVSGVTAGNVKQFENTGSVDEEAAQHSSQKNTTVLSSQNEKNDNKHQFHISIVAKIISYTMAWLYQSGKDAVSSFMSHVLPLMIGVSIIIGTFNFFHFDHVLLNGIKYPLGTLTGLLIVSIIFSLPVFSRLIGAGATFSQVLVTLLGYEIALGNISFIWILPALFASNVQVGCDFLPTALQMTRCEQQTVIAGVKAVLYSRLFSSVICVFIAFILGKIVGF